MKFTKISIRNFLSIKEADFRLDERGLVLISGENTDDSSQDSNGSGKSALVDSISFCCYGVTARGESGNDIINNRVSRGGATVSLEIDDSGTLYKITRTRLKGKGTLEVELKEKGKWKTLTKGTMKLTQVLINQIIGCSEDVFNNAIYSGQEKTPDLPGMTDKMLKLLIEEAAGTARLEAAYKVARERANDTAKAITAKTATQDATQRLIQSRKEGVDRLIGSQSDWEDQHKENLKESAILVRQQKDKAQKAQATFETASKDKEGLESALKEVNTKLASMDSYQRAVNDAQKVVNEQTSELRLVDREITQNTNDTRKLKADYESVGKIVGTGCDTCGKPYTEDDIATRKKILKGQLNDAIGCVKRRREFKVEVEAKLSELQSELQKAKDAVPDTSTELKRRDTLSDSLRRIDDTKRTANDAAKQLRDEMIRLKKLKTQINPNDDLLAQERKLLKDVQQEYDELAGKIKALESEHNVRKAASQVFGPAGVRAHILDTVTPFLNDRTNHYLSSLTDGNISALWSTIDTNAKGEIKEKFAIAVQSRVGGKTFKGLSGGEKRKTRLACSMALQDLVSSRATKPIELYIADEIDHALDEAGLERLMEILEDKASDRGTVLVISHQPLQDWCSNYVTVVKSGGVSHLHGGALS
jgi:DNA repair exonuclease SbcCD ATPase subunit